VGLQVSRKIDDRGRSSRVISPEEARGAATGVPEFVEIVLDQAAIGWVER
jgi:hypothetical protein